MIQRRLLLSATAIALVSFSGCAEAGRWNLIYRTVGGAPVNTIAPTVTGVSAAPVVGEVATCNLGAWGNVPTGYTQQFKRAGTNISGATGTTYTLVDADAAAATRGAITCAVVATNAGGSASAVSAATGMPRRTYPTVTYQIGTLTRSGNGAVALANKELGLLGVGAAAPSTWTVGTASSGTDAHWSKAALNTPKVSGTGQGALTGTYVFPLTYTPADSQVETQTLTITTAANTYTLGETDDPDAFWAANSTGAAGKTIELATGSSYGASRVTFTWTPSVETFIKYADPARPSIANSFQFTGATHLTASDLVTGNTPGSINARYYFTGGSSDIHMIRPLVRATSTTIGGIDGPAAFRLGGVTNLTVDDADVLWTYGGINEDVASVDTNIIFNRPHIRYFSDNGVIVGSSTGSTLTFNDPVFMSPMRQAGDGTHLDFFQTSDTSANSTINVNRAVYIQADGNASSQGQFLDGSGVSGANGNTFHIDGLIYVGRAYHGLTFGNSKSSTVKRTTVWKSDSGPVATPGTGYDDSKADIGPWFYAPGASTQYTGTNTLDRTLLFGQIINTAGSWTIASGVHSYSASQSAPAINTGFIASNPYATVTAIDYTQSFDAIVTAVKSALRPVANGSYKRGDGSYDGALCPDGSWATDSACP